MVMQEAYSVKQGCDRLSVNSKFYFCES